ncbi:hypothetical protein D3C80_850350 [compost metagenome]
MTIDRLDRIGHGRVGHRAVGLQIPGKAPLARALHGRREDQRFQRAIAAAGCRQRRDAHVIARLDIVDRRVGDAGDLPAVLQHDLGVGAFACLHRQRVALQAFDRAAHANLIGGLRSRADRYRHQSAGEDRETRF